MARKRRKRRSGGDDSAPLDARETTLGDQTESSVDESCLSHPGHKLDSVCDDCAAGLCRMCAISFGSAGLCSECFEVRVGQLRRGGSWHGWAGLALALFGVAAVTAPFTVGTDPKVMAAFPGGQAFFIYGSSIGAALGVLFGLGAQDFAGLGKRAGLVAAGLGGLVLIITCVLNATKALAG